MVNGWKRSRDMLVGAAAGYALAPESWVVTFIFALLSGALKSLTV